MGTTTQKTPWNPAFVGALGFIFILASALVGITLSWQSTKEQVGFLRDQVKENRDDIRMLRQDLQDQKDYNRDALDQLARDLGLTAPRPPKRTREK